MCTQAEATLQFRSIAFSITKKFCVIQKRKTPYSLSTILMTYILFWFYKRKDVNEKFNNVTPPPTFDLYGDGPLKLFPGCWEAVCLEKRLCLEVVSKWSSSLSTSPHLTIPSSEHPSTRRMPQEHPRSLQALPTAYTD
jgi:hypothetical protein